MEIETDTLPSGSQNLMFQCCNASEKTCILKNQVPKNNQNVRTVSATNESLNSASGDRLCNYFYHHNMVEILY
jgi:hypothetical protein